MNKTNRDRISFDLRGLRDRIEEQATEPGQPLSSVIRTVLLTGLEFLETLRDLNISPPRPEEIRVWLTDYALSKNNKRSLAELLINWNSQNLAEQAAIPLERILAIKSGVKATANELVGLSKALRLDPAYLQQLQTQNEKISGH